MSFIVQVDKILNFFLAKSKDSIAKLSKTYCKWLPKGPTKRLQKEGWNVSPSCEHPLTYAASETGQKGITNKKHPKVKQNKTVQPPTFFTYLFRWWQKSKLSIAANTMNRQETSLQLMDHFRVGHLCGVGRQVPSDLLVLPAMKAL